MKGQSITILETLVALRECLHLSSWTSTGSRLIEKVFCFCHQLAREDEMDATKKCK